MPPTPSPQPNKPAVSSTVLNPTAMSVAEVAKLLSAGGGKKISPEEVQADIDAGAPVNANGKINLVHYTAWLLREMQTGGD